MEIIKLILLTLSAISFVFIVILSVWALKTLKDIDRD